MRFVLDNSVVGGWLLEDQATAYTEAVAARLATDRALAEAARTAGVEVLI